MVRWQGLVVPAASCSLPPCDVVGRTELLAPAPLHRVALTVPIERVHLCTRPQDLTLPTLPGARASATAAPSWAQAFKFQTSGERKTEYRTLSKEAHPLFVATRVEATAGRAASAAAAEEEEAEAAAEAAAAAEELLGCICAAWLSVRPRVSPTRAAAGLHLSPCGRPRCCCSLRWRQDRLCVP
eukprot:scaffold21230_cov60-Phaeocystis_antarctica.AAC.5